MATLIRNDQADIRVQVDGKTYFENWASYTGGELTASDAKTRTGGMAKEKSAGGTATRGDATIGIAFDDVVAGFHNELENKCGYGAVVLSIQYVQGPNRTPIPGAHFVRRGTLLSAHLPPGDINATSAVDNYEIVVGLDEQAA